MARSKSRFRQPTLDNVIPTVQAMFENHKEARERASLHMASEKNRSALIERVAARMTDAGFPPEKIEKLKAAMEGKSGHYKRQERAEAHRAEIERMNGEGMRDGEIARALGLSRPRVCQVRAAHGISAVSRKP